MELNQNILQLFFSTHIKEKVFYYQNASKRSSTLHCNILAISARERERERVSTYKITLYVYINIYSKKKVFFAEMSRVVFY